jgi:hypothetical protein
VPGRTSTTSSLTVTDPAPDTAARSIRDSTCG